MLFRLVVEKKGKRLRVIEVRTPTAVIGRGHGNAVRIPSARVSRKHCRLREEDGLVMVEDLESVNGTYLNDNLITGEVVVRPGDRVEVGPVTFVVEYELTPRALERLRNMDYDVVVEAEDEEVVPEAVEDEEIKVQPRRKPTRRAPVEEEIEDVEEVVEDEDFTPSFDLDDVSFAPQGEGDLRDLLSQLDEGQESLMPKKRAMPRKKGEEQGPPPKPDNKGRKRHPKPEGPG